MLSPRRSLGGDAVATLVTLAITPGLANAQSTCHLGPALPAYSHNDYENPRPLQEAVELGFRGVEADVIYRGGELRVAHEPALARPGRTLERLYLQPLRGIVQQCGRVVGSATSFLLNVELKERSQTGYDSLLAVLNRYPDLFQSGALVDRPPVQVILVGWNPTPVDSMFGAEQWVWHQERITRLSPEVGRRPWSGVRLVSLDYGKTIGWSGEGPPPDKAARWLARLRAAKGEGPGRLARAYNAPVHSAVYRLLLEGGVDLIGSERLVASQRLLRTNPEQGSPVNDSSP